MKVKLYKILTILLIILLSASPALARGAVSLGGAALGSLILYGTAIAGGNSNYSIQIVAIGPSLAECRNPGNGNLVPGQNYPHVEAMGEAGLDSDGSSKKGQPGKRSFTVHTEDGFNITWDEAGCPNSNWDANVIFVFWDTATLSLVDAEGNVVDELNVACKTEYTGPQNDGNTFDDGTVFCWEVH